MVTTHQVQSPHPYTPGNSITLRVLNDESASQKASEFTISVGITHAFLPFTKSQAMRISLPSDAPPELPPNAVLKLYDRRWIDDRHRDPWSMEHETIARAAWNETQTGTLDPLAEEFSDDSDDEFYDQPSDDDDDDPEALGQDYRRAELESEFEIGPDHPAETEEYYRKMEMKRFRHEREAYARLTVFQGKIIPRCYAAVQVVPSDNDRDVPQAFVYGLILEDVGGVDLNELDTSGGDYVALAHTLMTAVHTFPWYGVLHHDIRSGNILISRQPSGSTRMILIDFGHSVLRPPTVTDKQWARMIDNEGELEELRWILNNQGIRDRTPNHFRWRSSSDASPSLTTIKVCNMELRQRMYPTRWKLRWFNKGPGDSEAEKPDIVNVLPEWLLKDDIAAWLDSRPPPPHCFLIPRPGSPPSHAPHIDFPLPSDPERFKRSRAV